MKKVLLIFIISLFHSVNAQGYNFEEYKRFKKIVNTCDSLEEYSKSIVYYDSMFSTINFYPYDYFYAFKTAWKNGDSIKANNYLIKGALKGLDISQWFGKELDHFLGCEIGMKYLKIKDSLIEVHYTSIDKEYYDELKALVRIDQIMRDGSPEMIYNDSLNFDALIKLCLEKGFPTYYSTGYGCDDAWLLLWHHRGPEYPISPQWKQIIPLIENEIIKGTLDPDFLEMHDDFNKKNAYKSK